MSPGRVESTTVGTYETISGLPLALDSLELEPLRFETAGGWTRITTVVRLKGDGREGLGEDVTWEEEDQTAWQQEPPDLPLAGEHTLASFSTMLDQLDLFPRPPQRATSRPYRRWALEAAALDLALRQKDRGLAEALGRTPGAVRFVVSPSLGDPPSLAAVQRLLDREPNTRFKLDPTPAWTDEMIAQLAELGAVDVLDFKGLYTGTVVDTPADPGLYARVAEAFPDAWLEDPLWNDETGAALESHRERVSWDYPIHSVDDIGDCPFPPRVLNIKPSRFGSLERLFETYDHCSRHGIVLYGGGQLELGVGRSQVQTLASLFHADAPNDVAPTRYNEPEPPAGLPRSPLPPAAPGTVGFR